MDKQAQEDFERGFTDKLAAAGFPKEAARGDHFAALLRGSLKAMKNPDQMLTLSPKMQEITGVTKQLPMGRMGPGPGHGAAPLTTGPFAGMEPFTAKDMLGLARTRARNIPGEMEQTVARGKHPRIAELKEMMGGSRMSPEMRADFVPMMDATYYSILAEMAKSIRASGIKPIYKG